MKKNAALKAQAGQVWKTLSGTGSLGLTYRSITVGLPVCDKVTTHRQHRTKAFGYVMVGGRSVWWMRYGLAVQLFGR